MNIYYFGSICYSKYNTRQFIHRINYVRIEYNIIRDEIASRKHICAVSNI